MKIIHVETGMHLYGGAQQVAYLLKGLKARGVENLLVCPPRSAIALEARKSGIEVHEIPCNGDLDFRFLSRLIQLFRAEQPELVHLHSRRGADVLGGIAACRTGVHAVLSRRVDNPESRWLLPLKYRMYERVICISEGIAAVLNDQGVDAAKLRVVRSALDPDVWMRAKPRPALDVEFGIAPERLCIGVVAQLIERKGHAVLFDALSQLPAHTPPYQLLIFGQGPLRAELERLVGSFGLRDRVVFAGFRKDLSNWMGALDLMVHPAFAEGLGVSLLQAQAAGLPVIASRVGGIPEAIVHQQTGVLVAPGDAQALSQAIADLLNNRECRVSLGMAGRRRILGEFSVDAMVDGNLAVYRDVLNLD